MRGRSTVNDTSATAKTCFGLVDTDDFRLRETEARRDSIAPLVPPTPDCQWWRCGIRLAKASGGVVQWRQDRQLPAEGAVNTAHSAPGTHNCCDDESHDHEWLEPLPRWHEGNPITVQVITDLPRLVQMHL